MSVLFIALPLALGLGAAAMVTCVYCIRNGQFEDLDSASLRIFSEAKRIDHAESPKNHRVIRHTK